MNAPSPVDLSPVRVADVARRSRRRTFAVLAVLALAVVALLSQGLLHNLNYFETVAQAEAHRATLGTRELRLEGVVEAHTIARTSTGASFWLRGGKYRVFVRASGSPPQLFQANIPVVVVGHFVNAHAQRFAANQIMVKHSANYIAAHPKRVTAPNGTTR
ncbi:MAG: cytochrome c maturation protein CcmE [Acidobacteriota bacterium]|nr:cytochrome c maturation protein CcmE [Acidobacteriota bacterium]MDE3222094.1 cytochrome c maturation protein CcmE [Acidobacteriota bacterium]